MGKGEGSEKESKIEYVKRDGGGGGREYYLYAYGQHGTVQDSNKTSEIHNEVAGREKTTLKVKNNGISVHIILTHAWREIHQSEITNIMKYHGSRQLKFAMLAGTAKAGSKKARTEGVSSFVNLTKTALPIIYLCYCWNNL